MDGFGHQVFADAAFTPDQDGGIRIRDTRDDCPDGAHLGASVEERMVARGRHDLVKIAHPALLRPRPHAVPAWLDAWSGIGRETGGGEQPGLAGYDCGTRLSASQM